jgi:HAD superfamily hydrolase (TIGR01484 family)
MPDMVIFATDLDNTLIHSYKTAKAGDICVENYNGREHSFMSKEAFVLLKKISEKCLIIPVTTRSLEQYQRLDLGLRFDYAVVAHGALLLADGEVDKQWENESRKLFSAKLPQIYEDGNIYDIRQVENTFIFAKACDTAQAVNSLQETFVSNDFNICAVNNKVYIFPQGFDKGVAIERLRQRLKPKSVICAGDNSLDIPMLEAADTAFAPKSLNIGKFCVRIDETADFTLALLGRVCDCMRRVRTPTALWRGCLIQFGVCK